MPSEPHKTYETKLDSSLRLHSVAANEDNNYFVIFINMEKDEIDYSEKLSTFMAMTEINNQDEALNYLTQYNQSLDIFETINQHKPQIFIWLGNAVQIAEPNFVNPFKSNAHTPKYAYELYNKLSNLEEYKKLSATTDILGTYDDLDYGIVRGNRDFADKEYSKNRFLDFLEVPQGDGDPRREVGKGIYSTYIYGNGDKSFRLIVLDTRFHKSNGIFKKDMLGEEQWEWLENVLENDNEVFTFIISATPILPFKRILNEGWYSESRKRLFKLLGRVNKNGIVFLSGGTKFAQISKTSCVLPGVNYNLYEITSSGLSNTIGDVYMRIFCQMVLI